MRKSLAIKSGKTLAPKRRKKVNGKMQVELFSGRVGKVGSGVFGEAANRTVR